MLTIVLTIVWRLFLIDVVLTGGVSIISLVMWACMQAAEPARRARTAVRSAWSKSQWAKPQLYLEGDDPASWYEVKTNGL